MKNLTKKHLPKVQLVITILCFLLLATISALSIRRYFQFKFLVKTYTLSTDQRYEFTLTICMPVQLAYTRNYISSGLTNVDISAENELLFENESFEQIEQRTNDLLYKSIYDVHLRRGGLISRFDERRIINQTIFKAESYIKSFNKNETQFYLLSRCFRIDLDVKEPKYIRSSAFTEIIFNLTHPYFQTFQTDFQKRLTSYQNITKVLSKLYLQKLFFLPAPYESDCLVYSDAYECDSRSACRDWTFNKYYIGNHSSIPTSSVVYREDYEDFDLAKIRFNTQEDQPLRTAVEKTFPKKDCSQTFFIEELEQDQILKDGRHRIFVDIYYFKEIRYEEAELTFMNLLLLIFNYETLIIGLNFRGTADWILGLLRSNRNVRTKWHRIAKLILNFICIGSFLFFSYDVVGESISDELTRSTYFEKVKEIYLPGFTICFPIDLERADPHRKLTKMYMDELSANLTLSKIFDKATYFDHELYERNLSFADTNSVNRFFRYKSYYSLSMKCFDFFANVTFTERQLFHFSELFFLKIYLKPEIYSKECGNCLKTFISFFEEGLGDFERLAPYYLRMKKKTKVSLRIRPNLIEVDYNDKFFFVRRPFSLFNFRNVKNPDMVYLKKMKAKFSQLTNCTTHMLFTVNNNGLEFCDDLFDQYFDQVQKHIDQSFFINPNFVSIFYNINPIATFEPADWPELVFIPLFIRIKQIIVSKVNVAEAIINILNALSFCLGKSILDVRINLHKLSFLFIRTHSLLLKLKIVFNPKKLLV